MSLNVIQPRPKLTGREIVRIVLSMTGACLIGAAVLGLVYLGTDRYRRAAGEAAERQAIRDMLGLDAAARVTEVRQFLARGARRVVYRAAAFGDGAGRAHEVAFTLDGALAGDRDLSTAAPVPKDLAPLGRFFVATRSGGTRAQRGSGPLAGFVVEGRAQGYKSPVRFFVAMTPDFGIADMRVIETADDPGLGAEVAQDWFREQYVGRTAEEIANLSVTKDPMPEDWKAALVALAKRAPDALARHRALLERERAKPIYAVTGATISSRAVTEGVRATVDHVRRRWWLLAPRLEGQL
ncbi:MAG TPA: FMN-binding protein [Terriglobales bacterium]|nr:FMN-binding protein [Terriglobales bacterium]